MGRINIEIEEKNHRKMKSLCALRDETISKYINNLLEDKISKIEKKRG